MTEQIAIQNKLREYFLEAQKRNPQFSLRALAKKIQIGPSAASEILSGKRKISKEMADKILTQLGCDYLEKIRLLNLFEPDIKDKSFIESHSLKLTADQYHLIGDWYHFAILSLAETVDFKADPLWIAKRLAIKLPEAEIALERLNRLGLIEWSRIKKTIRLTQKQITTSDEVSSQAIHKSHLNDLELAKKSMDQDLIDHRDFTSMTLAIDIEKLPQAKKMIREFYAKLSGFLESGNKNEIYKLNIQLFPLSKKIKI